MENNLHISRRTRRLAQPEELIIARARARANNDADAELLPHGRRCCVARVGRNYRDVAKLGAIRGILPPFYLAAARAPRLSYFIRERDSDRRVSFALPPSRKLSSLVRSAVLARVISPFRLASSPPRIATISPPGSLPLR
jgi:hypothetical protein